VARFVNHACNPNLRVVVSSSRLDLNNNNNTFVFKNQYSHWRINLNHCSDRGEFILVQSDKGEKYVPLQPVSLG
jgi:hypothetical protein